MSNNGSVMTANATGEQSFSRTFTYDELNRLKTMAWSVCNYAWGYDVWGNRTSQDATGGTGPCGEHFPTFNTKNQIADTGYTYDAAGNLIAEPGRTYQYDAENRLISINNGSTATYIHDALGRRTASAVTGSPRVRYIYNLDGNVVAEFEGTSWMRGYAHAGGMLIGQYKSSQLFYSHKDLLGSTRLMSKVNLTVQECDDYLPFGELDVRACLQPPPPTTTIARKFTGHYRDTESGLDHTLFRKYSSTFGRWLTPDPLAGSVDDPQSLNRFAYVRNIPTNLTDPLGLCDNWVPTQTATGISFDCAYPANPLSLGGGQLTLTSVSSGRFARLYPSMDRLLGWPTAAANKLAGLRAIGAEWEERARWWRTFGRSFVSGVGETVQGATDAVCSAIPDATSVSGGVDVGNGVVAGGAQAGWVFNGNSGQATWFVSFVGSGGLIGTDAYLSAGVIPNAPNNSGIRGWGQSVAGGAGRIGGIASTPGHYQVTAGASTSAVTFAVQASYTPLAIDIPFLGYVANWPRAACKAATGQ